MSTKQQTKSRNRYVKKGPKPYQQWLNEHRDEVLATPSKDRTEYVKTHLHSDINIDMPLPKVYQLLYRNNMIEHLPVAEPKKYVPKGPKPWKIWLIEHSAEFIHMPSNERVDYVFEHLNADLNISKSKYDIYQLLYRNNLLKLEPTRSDQVSDTHSDIHSDQDVKLVDHEADNSSEQEADTSSGHESDMNSGQLLFTLSDMTSRIDSLSHSDINPEFIQDITQRYIKILSKINADFAELNELKKELATIM